MTVYIKVKNDKIYDIKFKTYGCVAAIASSSIATELVKGKKLNEAMKLSREDVSKELGGLPAIKMHYFLFFFNAGFLPLLKFFSKVNMFGWLFRKQ